MILPFQDEEEEHFSDAPESDDDTKEGITSSEGSHRKLLLKPKKKEEDIKPELPIFKPKLENKSGTWIHRFNSKYRDFVYY